MGKLDGDPSSSSLRESISVAFDFHCLLHFSPQLETTTSLNLSWLFKLMRWLTSTEKRYRDRSSAFSRPLSFCLVLKFSTEFDFSCALQLEAVYPQFLQLSNQPLSVSCFYSAFPINVSETLFTILCASPSSLPAEWISNMWSDSSTVGSCENVFMSDQFSCTLEVATRFVRFVACFYAPSACQLHQPIFVSVKRISEERFKVWQALCLLDDVDEL